MVFSKTGATINGTTLDAVLAWIKTNIADKLPIDANLTYTITIVP